MRFESLMSKTVTGYIETVTAKQNGVTELRFPLPYIFAQNALFLLSCCYCRIGVTGYPNPLDISNENPVTPIFVPRPNDVTYIQNAVTSNRK